MNDPFLCYVLPRDRRTYLRHKERARALVCGRLERFNALYGFRYGRIFIKNLKRNWGSCSEKGNLNFNYKIAFLPAHLADYVVAHELCHLAEFNHSPRFWALLERAIPDHRAHRRELRKFHT